ncbi:glycosyltransferase [Cytobacillus firmus]|uniref:glycosyltransferase n=1 Tax=Cytobacillus firmus TaxID=1399 RepID=UPI003002ED52
MNKVFFGLSGGLGPVLRCLPVAYEFRNKGYEVSFSIYDQKSEKLIKELGFEVLMDDDPTVPDDKFLVTSTSGDFYNLEHYYSQMGFLDVNFTRSWVHHRIKMLSHYKPDIIFADMSINTVIAARFLNIPLVTFVQSCYHPGGISLSDLSGITRNISKVTPIFNQILEELDLSRISSIEDFFNGDLSIVPGIPELDPINTEKYKNVYYTGLDGFELVINPESPRTHEPYILVYPGRLRDSAGDSGLKIVRSIINTWKEKEQRIIISVSEDIPPEILEEASDNIEFIKSYSANLLKDASLFIHHGGHGSCLSAIEHCVPQLIIPTHKERLFNARQVYELGVGDFIIPDTFIGEHFFQLANYMIKDDFYNESLSKLKVKVHSGDFLSGSDIYKLAYSLIKSYSLK